MLTHINWLLKSRKRLPSGVQNQQPLAPATGIGSIACCADHSNSVCRFVSATISSLLIPPPPAVSVLVSVVCAVSTCPITSRSTMLSPLCRQFHLEDGLTGEIDEPGRQRFGARVGRQRP